MSLVDTVRAEMRARKVVFWMKVGDVELSATDDGRVQVLCEAVTEFCVGGCGETLPRVSDLAQALMYAAEVADKARTRKAVVEGRETAEGQTIYGRPVAPGLIFNAPR